MRKIIRELIDSWVEARTEMARIRMQQGLWF